MGMEDDRIGKQDLAEVRRTLEAAEMISSSVAARMFMIMDKVGNGKIAAERALLQLVTDYVNLRDLTDRLREAESIMQKHVDDDRPAS